MAWARIETSFPRNPKFIALKTLGRMGRDALLLHVEVLCYCREQLTDGNISRSAARTLSYGFPRAVELIELLEHHRLWDATDEGWRVHDYGEYNPSAEQIRASLKADAERKRRGRSPVGYGDGPSGVRPDVQADGRTESARSSPKSEVRSPELQDVASQRAPAAAVADAPLVPAEDPPAAPTPTTAPAGSKRPSGAGDQQGERGPGVAPAAAKSFQARFVEEHRRLYKQTLGVEPTDGKTRYVIVANLKKARVKVNGGDEEGAEQELLAVLRHAFAHPTEFMREQNAYSINAICSANVYDSLLTAMKNSAASGNWRPTTARRRINESWEGQPTGEVRL